MGTFPLVSSQWLKGALQDPQIVLLDATFHLPIFNRNAQAEFEAEHIPGARFFDVDGIKDPENPLPHMVPSPDMFAKTVSAMGISNDSHVICYDSYGLFSAARPWWMFRLYGHEKVSVLDGGLPAWKDTGLPIETGLAPAPVSGRFRASWRPELIRTAEQIKDNLTSKAEILLDARPPERFDGRTAEPRPEVQSGHIPNSVNLPFTSLINPDTKKVQDIHKLGKLFHKAGIRPGKDKLVSSCGSGVTACTLALALHLMGDDAVAVYDGSWSEWGSRKDTPIITPSA